MSKKSFVSLSFTPRKLQVLQLNAKKTAVTKFATVDLPPKLIANYRVQDKKTLALTLQTIWKRLGLKERSVGIVVPEFSTFTKSLFLPHLDPHELDEAVRWQSQDFLPSKTQEMVMDWKIVQKQKDNYQILAVAIQKNLLSSFVDTVGEAGLFPLVVETPSLSLSRITNNKNDNKLIIYANFGEAILAIVRGEEVLGSSVLSSKDQNGILRTAKQMTQHYRNINIKKIEVGGLELSQQLLNNLKQNLTIAPEWTQAKIIGLTSQQIQEYLVPISLQLKNPAEPLDETTINLLPSIWVKYYQGKKLKLQTWSLMIAASIVIWSCFFAALGAYLFLKNQIRDLKKTTTAQAVELPKHITDQISQINKLANKIIKISKTSKTPQDVASLITKAKPPEVSLYEHLLDLDTGHIRLRGEAKNRQVLINFKHALEKNKDFSRVHIPISTFEHEQNLEFELQLVYEPATKSQILTIPIK